MMPRANSIEKIPRSHSATIYVSKGGDISIDDFIVAIPAVKPIMMKKLSTDLNTITCFRTDKRTQYGVMADIMNQLREANCLRVSFEAKLKG